MKSLRIGTAALVLALVLPATASARDPGRWTLTGWSSVSNLYWQGVATEGPNRPLFFSGLFTGLHRTTRGLRETASVDPVIPQSVAAGEGYNHVGDIGFQGGRVLLPLECYTPGGPNGGNTCGTGSIGVADPATLAFQYYVKLDPAEILKAMWVEASPDGQLLWTSSGPGPAGLQRRGRRRGERRARRRRRSARSGASPERCRPSGVTGAAFHRGRLLLAGAQGTTYQVWSVDLSSGARRLELELANVQGEAEGLLQIPLLGGRLHFLVAPLAAEPTFGPTVGLLHFATGRWAGRGLTVTARASRRRSLRPRVRVTVKRARPAGGRRRGARRGRARGDGRARPGAREAGARGARQLRRDGTEGPPARALAVRALRSGVGCGRRGAPDARPVIECSRARARGAHARSRAISSTWRMFATSSLVGARSGLEPAVQDLLEQRRAGGPQRQRQHVRVVPPARAAGASRRRRTAPRARRGTLFAAIDAPVPVQQHTTPWSARPSATSRAAASLAHAQSSRSSSLSAPCTIGSWPRRRSSSTTASATPVRSSAAIEILIAASA